MRRCLVQGWRFNLRLRSDGYEVLCAGRCRGVGISQGLSHEGLRCAASGSCFSRRRAAARKASSSLRASSIRWGTLEIHNAVTPASRELIAACSSAEGQETHEAQYMLASVPPGF